MFELITRVQYNKSSQVRYIYIYFQKALVCKEKLLFAYKVFNSVVSYGKGRLIINQLEGILFLFTMFKRKQFIPYSMYMYFMNKKYDKNKKSTKIDFVIIVQLVAPNFKG